MGRTTINGMADEVAAQLEGKLRARGHGLSAKLRAAGRRLPRSVRAEAAVLERAAAMAQHPKLLVQVDQTRAAQAHRACLDHLMAPERRAKRRAMWAGIASSVAFSLFTVGLLVLAVLYWRGFI
jgi:hypothetical protein